MRIVTESQGDHAWHQARCGLSTASRMAAVMAYYKVAKENAPRQEKAERRGYRIELITERLTGQANEHYVSPDMELGTQYEPYAIEAYEREKRVFARKVGFVLHPIIDYTGASPDSLVGEKGGLECKCPRATTHMRWKDEARIQQEAGEIVTVPEKHQDQCLWVMKCCELEWVDFVSFCPIFPKGLDLHVVRMFRDEERIAKIEAEVVKFESEIVAALDYWKRFIKKPQPSLSDEEFESAYGSAPPIEDWAAAFDNYTSDEGMAP